MNNLIYLFVLLSSVLLRARSTTINLTVGLFLRLSTYDPATNTRLRKGAAWETEAAIAFLAIRHFNERDGSVVPALGRINNCPVHFIPHIFDSQSHPQPTLDSYLRSRFDDAWFPYRPDIAIGASRSAVTTPLAMLTSLHDVPQVSYWSTSTKLDDSQTYPTFLRTIPSDTSTATSIAELVAGAPFYARRLSMIYVKDAYGMSYMEALYDACVARNVSLDAYPFTFGDLSSIANSVKALKNSDARYIVAVVFDDDLETMARLAEEEGVGGTGKHLWIFTDSAQSFHAVHGDKARKTLDGSLRVLANGKGPQFEGWQRLEKAWSSSSSLIPWMNQHLPPLAITDPTFTFQLSTSLFDSNLKDRNDRGDVGDGAPYLYDAIASMGLAACAVATTSSSPSSSSSSSSTPLDGKDIHAKAKQQSFIGVSGRIEYNEAGSRSAETGRIEMTNLRIKTEGGVSTALVAFFSGGNWTFEDVDVWYAGNGTSPPPWRDPPSVDLHLIDEGVKVFIYVMVGVESALALCCAAWTVYFRNAPVVKASQPTFLLLVCVGAIVSTFVVLPLSLDQGSTSTAVSGESSNHNTSCRLLVPLFTIGFCVTFASLFAKQFRVWWVFRRAAKMKRAKAGTDLTKRWMLAVVLFVVIVDVALLVAWDISAPLSWKVMPLSFDEYGIVTSSVGSCGTDDSSTSWAFGYALVTLLFLLILVGNMISCRAMDLPSKYQESKWITYSMVSSFQVFAVGLPLMLLAGGGTNVTASFATRSIFVLLLNLGILTFLFGPKCAEHHQLAGRLRRKLPCLCSAQVLAMSSSSVSSSTSVKQVKSQASSVNRVGADNVTTNVGRRDRAQQAKAKKKKGGDDKVGDEIEMAYVIESSTRIQLQRRELSSGMSSSSVAPSEEESSLEVVVESQC